MSSFLATLLLLSACGGQGADSNPSTVAEADFSSFPRATVDMSLERVSEHVYYASGEAGVATSNQGFISTAGVIITAEGVVVLDALGTPSLSVRLLEEIRKITSLPIKYVVVTHYHADHVYGLQVFKALGAQIIAARGVDEYIDAKSSALRLEERRGSLSPWVNEATHLVRPDVYVDDTYRLSLGGVDMTLTRLGAAHSEVDLIMRVENDKVLFTGDLIFEGRIPFVGSADSLQWIRTLERIDTQGLAALIPGHGQAAVDPVSTIAATQGYLAYLRTVMGAAVDELKPFDEAYAEADWSAYESLPAFNAANRINAYQVYLALEAQALGGG